MKKNRWKLIWEVADAPIFEMGHGTVFADKKQKQLFGYSTKGQVLFAKNEILFSYHTVDDLEEASLFGFRFYSNHKNWEQFLNEFKKIQQENKTLDEKVEKLFAEANYDKKELGKLLLEVSNAQIVTFCHFNMTNPNFTFGVENRLRKHLKRTTNNSTDEILGILTTPEKLSTLQIETLEFYKILKKHWVNIKKKPSGLIKDLTKHSQKYIYLAGNEGNDNWDLNYYLNLVNEILGKKSFTLDKEIQEIETYSKKTSSKKKAVLRKNKIGSAYQGLAEKLADIGHLRLELRIIWSTQYRMLRKIVYQISKTMEVPAYDLLVCSPKELYCWFISGKRLTKKEILSRRNAYLFVLDGKKIQTAYGSKAINFKQKLIPDKDFSKTKAVEGKPAYPGLIRGKAFVFNWGSKDFNKQISDMPEGAILVAGQTRPSLMPAIRKARAIVTDEGGITSHAAIVSRELKIPCVIGTEFATKIFKTGDLLKVDAQKGIARLAD